MRRMLLAAALLTVPLLAWADPLKVKIGVITDMSGSLAAQSGPGSVVAAQLARDDCLAGPCKGMDISIISADHKNDATLATSIVREWVDRDGVDAVTDIVQATVQIAVAHLMAEKGKIALYSGGTAAITNQDCTPQTSVQWMWDTYGQAVGNVGPLAKPGSKWFFIIADYAFGHGLEADAKSILAQHGATVVGDVAHPFNFAGDFSPFLLQAQASGADVIAVGSTGGDLVNLLKQAHEFGVPKPPQKLVSFVLTLDVVKALGLQVTQGVEASEAFYWNMDPEARAWSERFFAQAHAMPTTIQAGVYSVTLGYLKAVAAAGTTDRAAVMAKLHSLPIQDPTMHNASIEPNGRVIHDSYLWRVKSPAESKEPWDFYEKIATIPAAEAFRPLDQTLCPKDKWYK
jgi:branched-chain amino acid transport system substrate-binding protein